MANPSLTTELWRARDLLGELVRADLTRRFSGSAFGVGWVFLQPLLQIGILTAVFSTLLRVEVPGATGGPWGGYALFLCAGFLPWLALDEAARSSCVAFTANAPLILHTSHSRLLFVVAPVVASSILLAFSLGVVVAVAGVLGVTPGGATLWLVPLLVLQALFSVGSGLALATLQTWSRDLLPLLQSLLAVVFWATPVVYHPDLLPESVRGWAAWNPLSHVLACYRSVVLETTAPSPGSLVVFGALVVLALVVGAAIFRRGRGTLADRV